MTFTGDEVDRIVDLLSELAPPSAVSMGFFTYMMMLNKSMLTENSVIDTDEVEDHLPAKIAIEVASIASEIASIAGEAARIARDVASILKLQTEERSLFPRRQKAKLEPKEIDGGQTGRPADESCA